jgi:hypothetical protein
VIQRQHYPESCAGAGLAFYLNPSTMRFHNHLGLKHADAKALLLCCLKGAEKSGLYERRTHPASIVGD